MKQNKFSSRNKPKASEGKSEASVSKLSDHTEIEESNINLDSTRYAPSETIPGQDSGSSVADTLPEARETTSFSGKGTVAKKSTKKGGNKTEKTKRIQAYRKRLQLKKERLEEAKKALEECQTDLEMDTMIDVILKEKKGVKITLKELNKMKNEIKQSRLSPDERRPWEVDPEPYEGDIDVHQLVSSMESIIESYTVLKKVAIPHAYATVCALWAMATWFVDSFIYAPYLMVSAPAEGSGKSAVIELLSRLSRRPYLTTNLTAPFLFRVEDDRRLTFFLDEAHRYINTDEMLGILNGGFKKGFYVGRMDAQSNNTLSPKSMSPFGFKAISGIAVDCLPTELVSRCIVIPLQRRKPTEEIDCFDYLPQILWEDFQSKMAKLREMGNEWINGYVPEVPKGLIDRDADKWKPLFSLADWLDHIRQGQPSLKEISYGKKIREIALFLVSKKEYGSPGVELLEDINFIFLIDKYASAPFVLSADLIKELTTNLELPNGNFYNLKCHPRQVAKALKGFGIEPKLIPAKNNRRGYFKSDFDDAFQRYLNTPVAANKGNALDPPEMVIDGTGV